MTPEWLENAYRRGIFPWYMIEQGPVWFSPDPRCVLPPSQVRIHKSMRAIFNQNRFAYSFDACFGQVMRACAEMPRDGVVESWITQPFIEAYVRMYNLGYGHSVEVWDRGALIGGLYGLVFGRVFFGESMFSLRPNASKAALITLAQVLDRAGFVLIDCQQSTPHLQSLGARDIPRVNFLHVLERHADGDPYCGRWEYDTEAQELRVLAL